MLFLVINMHQYIDVLNQKHIRSNMKNRFIKIS